MLPYKSVLKALKKSSLFSIFLISTASFTLACVFFWIFTQENTKTTVNDAGQDFVSQEAWFRSILSNDHIYDHEVIDLFDNYLQINDQCQFERLKSRPKFSKLVLIIIDALRIDFLPTILGGQKAKARMPCLEKLYQTNGIALQSIATMPTVTVPSTKAIISGKLPSFIEYLQNLNAYTIEQDNIVTQLKSQKKKIHFFGDHIWGKLFHGQKVFDRYNETFTVPDYVSADRNVSYNMRKSLKDITQWDVMMLHYSGVDQIGHMYSYGSPFFNRKLVEMDNEFRKIFDTLKKEHESSLIVVTGDHGMSAEGNHGGNSRDETHTLMVFLTPNSTYIKNSSDENITPSNLAKRTFLQVDFVPTLASFFHFPVPQKSQGRLMSPVLERFNVEKGLHLCSLFENVYQLQNVTTNLRAHLSPYFHLNSHLLEAMKYHVLYIQSLKSQEVVQYFDSSLKYYQLFLSTVQKFYGENQNNYAVLLQYFLLIITGYACLSTLVYFEFRNSKSVLFWDKSIFMVHQKLIKFKSAFTLAKETLHSFDIQHFIIAIFILNFFFLISTDFMQLESLFWYAVSILMLSLNIILVIKNYFTSNNLKEHKNIFLNVISIFIVVTLLINWRQVNTIEDAWGADTNLNDIYSDLKKSTFLNSFLFTISIFILSILAVISVPSTLSFVFSSSYLTVYIFKTQNYLLYSLFMSCTNICLQVFVGHIILSVIYFAYFKYQRSLPLKIANFLANNLVSSNKFTCKIAILRQFWTLIVCTQLKPAMVPLLLLNILLEKMINSMTSDLKKAKPISILGVYLILANTSFYQVGNSNGLSTLNVNSCFHGFNGSQTLQCTSFMFVAIFSTYIYWILSYFVHFQNEICVSSKKQQHKEASKVFKSILNTIQIWRFSLLSMMLTLTFFMRNHPFIWPVIAPKLLYELLFTFVNLLLVLLIVLLFQTDLTNLSTLKEQIM